MIFRVMFKITFPPQYQQQRSDKFVYLYPWIFSQDLTFYSCQNDNFPRLADSSCRHPVTSSKRWVKQPSKHLFSFNVLATPRHSNIIFNVLKPRSKHIWTDWKVLLRQSWVSSLTVFCLVSCHSRMCRTGTKEDNNCGLSHHKINCFG